jgi:hypothetical protein
MSPSPFIVVAFNDLVDLFSRVLPSRIFVHDSEVGVDLEVFTPHRIELFILLLGQQFCLLLSGRFDHLFEVFR